VLDEAYFEYVEWNDYPNGIVDLKGRRNAIVLRTFSKAYGLAGARVGYGVMHPELVGYLNRTRMPFNLTSLGQVAAAAAILRPRRLVPFTHTRITSISSGFVRTRPPI